MSTHCLQAEVISPLASTATTFQHAAERCRSWLGAVMKSHENQHVYGDDFSVSSKAWRALLSVPALFSLSTTTFPFFFPPWVCNIFNFGTAHLTLVGIQNALAGTKLLRDYCPGHPGLNLTIRNSICILKVKFIVTTTTAVDKVQ